MAGLRRAALSWLAVLLVAGCPDDTNTGDGGSERGMPVCGSTCDSDKSTDLASAIPLTSGKEGTGAICPVKDRDYFKIDHTGSLLNLDFSATLDDNGSPVQLTYELLDKDQKVLGSAPPWTAGIRHFQVSHCVQTGTYYVRVKDEGDDAKDACNIYRLKYTSGTDKDVNEPANNLPAGAKPPGLGYISCKGDLDWFTFSVGDKQVAEIKLVTAAATPLALKYSVYDSTGKTKLLEGGGKADAAKTPLNLVDMVGLPAAGTYLILIEDNGSARSDPATSYTLSVTAKADTDPTEFNGAGKRNDSPANATECGASCTKTGQVNSRGDYDYYKVDLAGVTKDNVGVIEIEVKYTDATTVVQPQVALVYADKDTACTKDACCRFLSGSCDGILNCTGRTFVCVRKDDTYCNDADCKPAAGCLSQQACAGAAVCLPVGFCGGEQFSRTAAKGTTTVLTAQPLLHEGPFYVRVGDDQSDNWDYGKNYSVRIEARMDPDGAKEPNSDYFPTPLPTNTKTEPFHRDKAKPTPYPQGPGVTTHFEGYISYQGDWDWYKMPSNCDGECTLTVNYSASGDCSKVQPIYQIFRADATQWFGWPAGGTPLSGQGGKNGCVYLQRGGTYYFAVSDNNHDGWSWSCKYSVDITTAANCNAPCVVHPTGGTCTIP